jgi:hypothetical protein
MSDHYTDEVRDLLYRAHGLKAWDVALCSGRPELIARVREQVGGPQLLDVSYGIHCDCYVKWCGLRVGKFESVPGEFYYRPTEGLGVPFATDWLAAQVLQWLGPYDEIGFSSEAMIWHRPGRRTARRLQMSTGWNGNVTHHDPRAKPPPPEPFPWDAVADFGREVVDYIRATDPEKGGGNEHQT